jgi:aarF domain-containing kinase
LDASFGQDWQEILCIDNHTPIGSGCVAQVYKGQLYHSGDSPVEADVDKVVNSTDDINSNDIIVESVAIKVLHPNIAQKMENDIFLMKYVASWIDCLYPAVYWVALTECVDEFSIIMEKQVSVPGEWRSRV